jgi:hypothetical protein
MAESRGQAGKKAPQGFSVFKRLFDDDRPWLAPFEPVSHPEFQFHFSAVLHDRSGLKSG